MPPHTHPTPRHTCRMPSVSESVNPYFFLCLRRPRSRNSTNRPSRSASVTTRRCAGSDLPGGRRTMNCSDFDAPAARGPPLGARARLQHTTFCMRALRTCICLTHLELAGELSLLLMMTFICSCRNNNQPTAIYPLGTFPRGLKKSHVMMLPSCPTSGTMMILLSLWLKWWCVSQCAKHFTVQPPSVPIYTNDRH
jgi:hypothetical protein